MKRLLPFLGMICTLSSCIYDSTDDNFYRTLWVSEEAPFSEVGQDSESHITLEFLCGGGICVTATGATGSYGTYQSFDNTAYFVGLTLTYYGEGAAVIATYRESEESDTVTIDDSWKAENLSEGTDRDAKATSNNNALVIIEEAHRTGDILLVSWHREGSPTSYSTRFIRRSSYE